MILCFLFCFRCDSAVVHSSIDRYELIVRHYLACCSQDAKGSETTILLRAAEEEFETSGLVIEALNYLEVYK
jgi:DNA topoisomerase-3